ncbi:hypothetical protein ABB30_15460 [Stenotrophomonas ginsengisoli]|uniref:Thiol:disulfide interchange protein DsbD N-terminal domain-containing protein n=1 Tax=Stenotrophomonas ginsengisoli TaxID=336566 RepID=A0A0R0CUM1_9GAMM|nr:hypothetical protein ABB30_15460 [Stenotrophomonas ginsengisoli]
MSTLLLLAVLLPGTVLAQVQAELVAAQRSVQPGQPLQLALRMQHDPHWHSFWKNAGTGLPNKADVGTAAGMDRRGHPVADAHPGARPRRQYHRAWL